MLMQIHSPRRVSKIKIPGWQNNERLWRPTQRKPYAADCPNSSNRVT
jgi:hypothetical protein